MEAVPLSNNYSRPLSGVHTRRPSSPRGALTVCRIRSRKRRPSVQCGRGSSRNGRDHHQSCSRAMGCRLSVYTPCNLSLSGQQRKRRRGIGGMQCAVVSQVDLSILADAVVQLLLRRLFLSGIMFLSQAIAGIPGWDEKKGIQRPRSCQQRTVSGTDPILPAVPGCLPLSSPCGLDSGWRWTRAGPA